MSQFLIFNISLLLFLNIIISNCKARIFIVDTNHSKASDTNPGIEKLPFKTITRAVKNLKPGDVVLIKAGVYRESVIIKANGTQDKPIVIKAYPGHEGKVIIKGSNIFYDWKRIPGTFIWFTSWKYNFKSYYPSGWDDVGPYAKKSEMVFINGMPLLQVLSKNSLSLNTFYVDNKNNKIYICVPCNPNETKVEISVRQIGILIYGSYIKIEGLTVTHIANNYKMDAGFRIAGHHIDIKNCKAIWNNLDGFHITGKNILMINCIANYNGRCGISANVKDSIIIGCETNYNCWRFGPLIHSGGIKIVGGPPTNVIVIKHISKNNKGPGIWFDYGCKNIKVERCFLHGNLFAGLILEACVKNIIVINNIICHSKTYIFPTTGTGIYINESKNIKIINNTIFENEGYGILIAGKSRVIHYTNEITFSKNIEIINNIIVNNKRAGLHFWVQEESAKPEAIFSHKIDYNLWWPKEKMIISLLKFNIKKWIKEKQNKHSIFSNPNFLNPEKHNFNLLPNSPAIDKALFIPIIKNDFYGNLRPKGKGIDIGAIESF